MHPDQSREQLKERIRESADIVQIVGECLNLKKAGPRFLGLCPFHAEKTPSFTVSPQRQSFHCFGCGESGDVFAFVMKYHHLDFPEALNFLARKYGIEVRRRALSPEEQARLRRRELLYAANEAAAVFYQECLADPKLGHMGREYLEHRGVPEAAIQQYRLGFAPDPAQAGWNILGERLTARGISQEALEDAGLIARREKGGFYDRFRQRVMFPLTDMSGRVVAFGGRILGEGQPKYMNSPESPVFEKSRLLFGLYQHREAIRRQRRALVVEGNFDLLLLAVHGIGNTAAPLGTALTKAHIHALRGYADEVVLLFDADTAGRKAAMRSIPFFLAERMEGRVALLPAGQDPDSYVRSEGPEAIVRLVEQARPLAEFAFEALAREHGMTLSGKSRIAAELNLLMAEASDPGQRELMRAHFSEKLGVSPGYFASPTPRDRERHFPEKALVPGPDEESSGLSSLARHERQLADFLLLYPEFFPELQEAGVEQALRHPAMASIFQLLGRAGAGPGCQPEHLLDCASGEEQRTYLVQLLTRDTGSLGQESHTDYGRRMCDEVLAWLHTFTRRREGAELQRRILEAERQGDMELLKKLMEKRLVLGRKK